LLRGSCLRRSPDILLLIANAYGGALEQSNGQVALSGPLQSARRRAIVRTNY